MTSEKQNQIQEITFLQIFPHGKSPLFDIHKCLWRIDISLYSKKFNFEMKAKDARG
jgi:hypothetical protein